MYLAGQLRLTIKMELVDTNPHYMTSMITDILQISKMSVENYLHQLKLCQQFNVRVPHQMEGIGTFGVNLSQASTHRQDHQFGCLLWPAGQMNTAIHQKHPALANLSSQQCQTKHFFTKVTGAWLGSFTAPSIFTQPCAIRFPTVCVFIIYLRDRPSILKRG